MQPDPFGQAFQVNTLVRWMLNEEEDVSDDEWLEVLAETFGIVDGEADAVLSQARRDYRALIDSQMEFFR